MGFLARGSLFFFGEMAIPIGIFYFFAGLCEGNE